MDVRDATYGNEGLRGCANRARSAPGSSSTGSVSSAATLLFCTIILLVAGPRTAEAQAFQMLSPTEYDTIGTIPQNSVTTLHAEGDTLWAGPPISFTTDGGETWEIPRVGEIVPTQDAVLFSMDVETPAGEPRSTVWAGLGVSDDEGVPLAAGFLTSPNGGRQFFFRDVQVDAEIFNNQGEVVEFDTVRYGASILPALRVTEREQSPPYDIDFAPAQGDSGVVWVAGWASGLRRSLDGGRTWNRVVLPPDNRAFIHPDSTYSFALAPFRGLQDDPGSYNHTAFSVLVDASGTIWAGTPVGVNWSYAPETNQAGDRVWRRVGYNGTPNGLTGSWVTAIEEQPLPGRNAIWMASWNAGEIGEQGRTGVTVTFDGGQTFQQVLYTSDGAPDRPTDFAFRGDTAYVAAQSNGIFVTADRGQSWRSIRHFTLVDEQQDFAPPPDIQVYAVATTRAALWAGTSAGVFKSTDGGETWRLFRVEVPLHPSEPTDAVPDVETYAYPNPFSPAIDRLVRIRFEPDNEADPEIRIFDFSMQLVRLLAPECGAGMTCEAVWDGRDDEGLRVANGAYMYAVEAGGETVWGKILVLE